MTQKLAGSKHFDPAVFIGEGWSAAEEDQRANDLYEIDISAIALVTCLQQDERSISGEERLKRLKETQHIRLGGRAFISLWDNQHLIPEGWKEKFLFVFFDGLILLHSNGNRYSLNLSWNDGGWHWYTGWLGNTRSTRNPSAVLSRS
jgi:hypothetical protein